MVDAAIVQSNARVDGDGVLDGAGSDSRDSGSLENAAS
jgi:hypothetical protein